MLEVPGESLHGSTTKYSPKVLMLMLILKLN